MSKKPLRIGMLCNMASHAHREKLRGAIRLFTTRPEIELELFSSNKTGEECSGFCGLLLNQDWGGINKRIKCKAVLMVEDQNTVFPSVYADDHEIGRLAARHFLSLGLEHVVALAISNSTWGKKRLDGFKEEMERHLGTGTTSIWPYSDKAALKERLSIIRRPAGLFVPKDKVARQSISLVKTLGFRVPDDVSIIGVDNDEFIAGLPNPTLSSIDPDFESVGYRAAAMLLDLIEQKTLRQTEIVVPPLGVIVRQSSPAPGFDNEMMRVQLYIRTHACKPICVGELAKVFSLSRRSLEMRFRKAFGVSPYRAILQARLKKVQELTTLRKLPLEEIGKMCGYADLRHFARLYDGFEKKEKRNR